MKRVAVLLAARPNKAIGDIKVVTADPADMILLGVVFVLAPVVRLGAVRGPGAPFPSAGPGAEGGPPGL